MIIFTIPKEFDGNIGVIQENAISSWVRLRPKPKIILLGNDPGVKEAAKKFKVGHYPCLKCNQYGTPLLSDAVEIVKRKYKGNVLALVHTDIILTNGFIKTVNICDKKFPEFLATGLRSDLKQESRLRFGKRWESAMKNRVKRIGVLRDSTTEEGTDIKKFNGSDYFVFSRNFYNEIPPFAIGRFFWDSWLQYMALELKKPWVDITNGAFVVHQDHHYLHVKSHTRSQKKVSMNEYYKSPEMLDNFNYLSGGKGIKEGWSRMFGPKYSPLVYFNGNIIKRDSLSLEEKRSVALKRNEGRYKYNLKMNTETNRTKVLCVQGAGLGNILQCLPAIGSLLEEKYKVDLLVNCNSNSSDDFDVAKMPGMGNVFTSKSQLTDTYDIQLNGPHAHKFQTQRAKKVLDCRIKYQQDIEESFVFYNLVQSIGVTAPRQEIKLNLPETGYDPPKGTVAIFPGCKPEWIMKRWHLYDELCKQFPHVMLFGTRDDMYPKHRNWFKKAWIWPDNAEIFYGNLKEVAYTMSKCEFFIGNDGGVGHLAAATGIPTFIICGPSSMIKNKPFGNNIYPVHLNLPCQPCQFKTYEELNKIRPLPANINKSAFGLTNNAKRNPQVFVDDKITCPFNMECFTSLTVDVVMKEVGSKIQLPRFN